MDFRKAFCEINDSLDIILKEHGCSMRHLAYLQEKQKSLKEDFILPR